MFWCAGWGATDNTGKQSQFPRQVDLSFNKTTDCDCKGRYILETNVGADYEDTCSGDSGQIKIHNIFISFSIFSQILDLFIFLLPTN